MTGRYPGGKRFAFTIFDDTDVATVENVKPVYDLLASLGMRTTKTVWPFAWHGPSNFSSSETLEDAHYVEWVRTLPAEGFEIASHGATMETSDRETTRRAHERLQELFGAYPRSYANHSWNRENLYWGADRIDIPWLKALYARYLGIPRDFYQGHDPRSSLWWGDLCQARHEYVRNLTFNTLDALEANPSMPYHDPSRPLVRYWFSATDAENCEEFVARFEGNAAERLERRGGVCIIATHLGKGFTQHGRVDARVEAILRDLAARDGWFVPVSELLDWLRDRHAPPARPEERTIPAREWRALQMRWARDLVARRVDPKFRRFVETR